jgi:hypothetical protein
MLVIHCNEYWSNGKYLKSVRVILRSENLRLAVNLGNGPNCFLFVDANGRVGTVAQAESDPIRKASEPARLRSVEIF